MLVTSLLSIRSSFIFDAIFIQFPFIESLDYGNTLNVWGLSEASIELMAVHGANMHRLRHCVTCPRHYSSELFFKNMAYLLFWEALDLLFHYWMFVSCIMFPTIYVDWVEWNPDQSESTSLSGPVRIAVNKCFLGPCSSHLPHRLLLFFLGSPVRSFWHHLSSCLQWPQERRKPVRQSGLHL